MSQDALLTHDCPHLTLEERAYLGSDRRTLLMRQPVASQSSVRLTVNDELIVPSTGLYSQAVLTGLSSGPFRIVRNETDLRISSLTATVDLTFPVSSRLPVDDVVSLINAQSDRSRILANNVKGYLQLWEVASLGGESRLAVSGRASDAIGFENLKGARGKQVYPGWRVIRDQRTDAQAQDRIVRFTSVVKQNPVFKVSYSTRASSCLRCGASLLENDWRYDEGGEIVFIENENLLYQASLKILLTRRGSSPFHTWFGSRIQERIGKKAIGTVTASISEDVYRALENLKTMQREQATIQPVTYRERLYSIDYVDVLPHSQDPTVFLVDVGVRNASQQPVELSIVYTVSDVIALQSPGGPSINALTAGLSLERLQALFPTGS